jgi:hypothetical protein
VDKELVQIKKKFDDVIGYQSVIRPVSGSKDIDLVYSTATIAFAEIKLRWDDEADAWKFAGYREGLQVLWNAFCSITGVT